MGIYDRSGEFLSVVYLCTLQRRKPGVSWCLTFLKRVVFTVQFSPEFIMMVADNAQYSASESELRESTSLNVLV